MRYVSSVERIGYDRGWDEGKTEGRTEGLAQGRIEAIELGLSLKFGDEGRKTADAIDSEHARYGSSDHDPGCYPGSRKH